MVEARKPEVRLWMEEDRPSNRGTKNTNAAKKNRADTNM